MAKSHFVIYRKKPPRPPGIWVDHPHSWVHWLPKSASKSRLKILKSKAAKKIREAKVKKMKTPVKRPVVRAKRHRDKFSPKTPHSTFTPGTRIITTVSGLPANRFVNTNPQFVDDAEREVLDSWVTVNGDHKHPNHHGFTLRRDKQFSGTRHNEDRFGNYTDITGAAVTSVSIPITLPRAFDDNVYNQAIGRLYDQIRGDIDLSIDLAESHKTQHMMADTLKGMRNLSTTFRKMRRSNPRDWGNLWLEFTYGWKPLAQSIYGSAHKLLLEPKRNYMVAKGSATGQMTNRSSVGDGVTQDRYDTVENASYRCKVVCRYGFADSILDSFAGFSSLNPVSIAWELTPYSFVVDWFLDVGGYLRNFESACLYSSNFQDGYVSEGYLVDATSKGKQLDQPADGSYVNRLDCEAYAHYKGFKRSVLSGSPFPRLPSFNPKLGASRLISGAALLGQQLASLKHPKGYGDLLLKTAPRARLPPRVKIWDPHLDHFG